MGTAPLAVATGDVDGDGDTDVVTTAGGRPVLLRNDGTGALVPGAAFGSFSIDKRAIELVDMNGDGRLDLVAGGVGRVLVYLGTPTGFATATQTVTNHELAHEIAVGDLDGDGDRDVVVAVSRTSRLLTYRNDGTGRLTVGVSYALGGVQTMAVRLADFDGDGRLDVAAAHSGSGATVLRGLAVGFGAATVVSPATGWDLAVGDVDRDGDIDLATTHRGSVALVRGNGDGTFGTPTILATGLTLDYIEAVDLDRDDDLELALTGGNDPVTAPGLAAVVDDGGVRVQRALRWRGGAVAGADLDGDGLRDLVTGSEWSVAQSIAVLRNTTVVGNTPPVVTVTDVADGATYEAGAVPSAGCAVDDGEDGASTFAPGMDADVDAFGLGTVTVTCTHTDTGGLEATATATYTVQDTIDPVISGSTPAAGWHRVDVEVSWTCSDSGSGVATCPSTAVLTGEGVDLSVTGTAIDNAGNDATATVGGVDIDRTAPVIAWTGPTAYTVDQDLAVGCTATDALSGLAASVCPTATGPATAAGTHTLTATATDNAGNTTTSTFTYTVEVTYDSLASLVVELTEGRGGGLIASLDAAGSAAGRGNDQAAANQLAAFTRQVRAQTGKSLTAAEAALLLTLVAELA